MESSTRTLKLLAVTSLVMLLAALFTPLFCGIVLWSVITLSIWEYSHLLTLVCAVVVSATILVPFIRPGTKAWLFPFLFGAAVFMATLGASVHSFPVANDLSNVLFHPYGLVLLAGGGLLCMMEGFAARSPSRS